MGKLTVNEVAQHLRVSRTKVYELMHDDLPYFQIGRRRIVDEEELERWVSALRSR